MPLVFGFLIFSLIAMALMLLYLFPYHPNSLLGWWMLFLLSLPIQLAGEFLGDKVLNFGFVKKLSPALRIVYGVMVGGALLAVIIFAQPLLDKHLSKWGS